MIKILAQYLQKNHFSKFDLKALLFDMDGVLYGSMPAHDKSWQQTMDEWGLKHLPNEFYLQEGRIGKSTIDTVFQRNLQRNATDAEVTKVYARKSELFQQVLRQPVHLERKNIRARRNHKNHLRRRQVCGAG